MLVLKDGGYGITQESLDFWEQNKAKIGRVTCVRVGECLEKEIRNEGRRDAFEVEYSFIAYGEDGTIMLSGCNCGYGGTGPNGTAKIMSELGVPLEEARKAMLYPAIVLNLIAEELLLLQPILAEEVKAL